MRAPLECGLDTGLNMAILNYTTSIDAVKTASEVQQMLAKSGAKSVALDYENGQPSALQFMILFCEQPIYFKLPCNVKGVYQSLCRSPKVSRSQRTEAQARRVAWRIIKDWVEAQLAIVEARQAEMTEVFLPYAVANDGRTAFQSFADSKQKLLTERASI